MVKIELMMELPKQEPQDERKIGFNSVVEWLLPRYSDHYWSGGMVWYDGKPRDEHPQAILDDWDTLRQRHAFWRAELKKQIGS